jgi:myo-inositol 2-dehydrogenase/D-chiro-inositol 1-dehydrogenase
MMINLAQFGAGRIGGVHATNVAANDATSLKWVVDVFEESAKKLADEHGAKASTDPASALSDPEVQGIIIASSTDTHLDLILEGVKAGKAVFCEKPIDLDLGRVDEKLKEIEAQDVPVLIGFNRRYDPNFKAVHDAIQNGSIGDLEMVKITSRDPSPPPIEYINVSGGLFRDMMIHDLDLARWLLGEEPVEVYASASCLVDPAIGEAGDIDTALVTMKTGSGKLCQIDNSRRAVYGYDQRMEVFGSKGMAKADNVQTNTVEIWNADHVQREKPPFFFLERYADAYQVELAHFVDVINGTCAPAVTTHDGRQALALADAALASSQSGRSVNPS